MIKSINIEKTLSEIRGYPYKKQQEHISNELRKLRLSNLAQRQGISQKDLNEIIRLKQLPLKYLKKIALLRNISPTEVKKKILFIDC